MENNNKMTQKEKLAYFIKKINENDQLKEEIYQRCDPDCFYLKEELAEDLDWLLEGGCKQDYDLIPFMNDGSGGLFVLVNDMHIAYMDSEGSAGYIAETIEDFVNILLVFKFFCYSEKSVKSFDVFMEEYNDDLFDKQPSELINAFIEEEHMETDLKTVYHKLVKGLTILPPFVIDPTDDEYVTTTNVLRMDDEEFYHLCENIRQSYMTFCL